MKRNELTICQPQTGRSEALWTLEQFRPGSTLSSVILSAWRIEVLCLLSEFDKPCLTEVSGHMEHINHVALRLAMFRYFMPGSYDDDYFRCIRNYPHLWKFFFIQQKLETMQSSKQRKLSQSNFCLARNCRASLVAQW